MLSEAPKITLSRSFTRSSCQPSLLIDTVLLPARDQHSLRCLNSDWLMRGSSPPSRLHASPVSRALMASKPF